MDKYTNRFLYFIGGAGVLLVAFAGLSDASAITQSIGNILGGMVGALGAYVGVREAIRADRLRDDLNRNDEAGRVRNALAEELRQICVGVRYDVHAVYGIAGGTKDPRYLDVLDTHEPLVFGHMAGRIDLLSRLEAGSLIHFYDIRRQVIAFALRFTMRPAPVQMSEMEKRVLLGRYVRLAETARKAVKIFGIQSTLTNANDEEVSLEAELIKLSQIDPYLLSLEPLT